MTDIYVDADACPVREEVYRVAGRAGIQVFVVHNGSRPIRPPGLPSVHMIIVNDSMDAADDWIADKVTASDVCVTADIPLASRCLQKGARVIAHDGHVWTENNIGAALAGRELSRHLRELGQTGGGNKAFDKADRSRFLNALDAAVTAARRA